MALIISEPQTRKLIDMSQAVTLLDRMFRDRAAGKMRSVPRRRLKGSEKQLNMMAAWHQDSDLICLRSYAADANTITLYHGRKGGIQAIINMGFLSSLRTGAATGVAAKYLAPANSKVLGVIGPGWQATFQVEAVAEACPIFWSSPRIQRRR
jgi:ornithine cyclodeaminase/alanine dehydrogenase-like protein (mu-crystallin family)